MTTGATNKTLTAITETLFTPEDDALFMAAWDLVATRNAVYWNRYIEPEARTQAWLQVKATLDHLRTIAVPSSVKQ